MEDEKKTTVKTKSTRTKNTKAKKIMMQDSLKK